MLFKLVKALLGLCVLGEQSGDCLSQLSQSYHSSAVSIDEPLIEVAETQEGLDLLHWGRSEPLLYGSDLGRIHF